MISINDFANMIIQLSGKKLNIKNIPGPLGVRGRKSDNKLIKEKLNWEPSSKLIKGIKNTFEWIEKQIN
jgi:nucleoside-diphosphate-sugar epimerase